MFQITHRKRSVIACHSFFEAARDMKCAQTSNKLSCLLFLYIATTERPKNLKSHSTRRKVSLGDEWKIRGCNRCEGFVCDNDSESILPGCFESSSSLRIWAKSTTTGAKKTKTKNTTSCFKMLHSSSVLNSVEQQSNYISIWATAFDIWISRVKGN